MRNLSQNARFRQIAAEHTPRYRFDGRQDFSAWRRELLQAVRASLGVMPQRVPLNAEIVAEWREGGLIKQRVIFDVEPGLSATAYVFRPEEAVGRLPAILACHGHGSFGKEPVMGNRTSADLQREIGTMNYDYGLRMAQAGFVVIAIDWRGFGERDDRRKPNWNDVDGKRGPGRDLCNLHYLRASMLGMTVLGMDLHDGQCALDYLCQQPFVDPTRIGVMGLSFGGTMAIWMSLVDDRIKAADVICYSDRFSDFGMRDVNICGSQITPGVYALCDMPDLQGLIAPRPLLVEIGLFDECFKLDSAMSCYKEVEKIFAAAGASDVLELDLFEGGHAWGGNKSVAFFSKHLNLNVNDDPAAHDGSSNGRGDRDDSTRLRLVRSATAAAAIILPGVAGAENWIALEGDGRWTFTDSGELIGEWLRESPSLFLKPRVEHAYAWTIRTTRVRPSEGNFADRFAASPHTAGALAEAFYNVNFWLRADVPERDAGKEFFDEYPRHLGAGWNGMGDDYWRSYYCTVVRQSEKNWCRLRRGPGYELICDTADRLPIMDYDRPLEIAFVVNATQVRAYCDGQLIYAHETDQTYAGGHIGICVWMGAFRFENMRLYELI